MRPGILALIAVLGFLFSSCVTYQGEPPMEDESLEPSEVMDQDEDEAGVEGELE